MNLIGNESNLAERFLRTPNRRGRVKGERATHPRRSQWPE
jgi:hypothetical protein